MAVENVELGNKSSPNHLCMEAVRLKLVKETDDERSRKEKIEKCKMDKKKEVQTAELKLVPTAPPRSLLHEAVDALLTPTIHPCTAPWGT